MTPAYPCSRSRAKLRLDVVTRTVHAVHMPSWRLVQRLLLYTTGTLITSYGSCRAYLSATAGNSGSASVRGPAQRLHDLAAGLDDHDGNGVLIAAINLAHGRGTGFHQLFQSRRRLESQLEAIARIFDDTKVRVACVQEADAASWWSGNFDHVEFTSRASRLRYAAHGHHVSGLGLSYGTAVLSQAPIDTAESHPFPSALPTPHKGFTVARIAWPTAPDVAVDVVSLHLDFARASLRKQQIEALVEILSQRDAPLIIAGDFNDEWIDDSAVHKLAAALDLHTWDPHDDIVTFPGTGRRLDWILASQHFAIESHRVLDDEISDHRMVIAELSLRTRPS